MSLIQPGVCRHCGCHGESCTLPDGDKCVWADSSRTVCNGASCVIAEAARVEKARVARPGGKHGERYVGWGYGAIVDDLRKRRRRKKRAA